MAVLASIKVLDENPMDCLLSTIVDSLNVFWLTLSFSMVGGLVFVLVLILVWFWFKARYMKKLLRAKPEVIRC